MSKRKTEGRSVFPPMYVPNEVKNEDKYGVQVFRAILDATSAYREKRNNLVKESRMYAQGKQPLQQYLDELHIEGSRQYRNISYTPTKILQKFEKIVVDDYQQLKETPKAVGKSYHIQERKERKKTDLKFRMEYKDYLDNLSANVQFPVEDPTQQVPQDQEELDLITSLNSEEREELLMTEMIDKVLKDNNIDRMKHQFLSDAFQVHFGGYRHYTDRKGKIRVDFIPIEDALYNESSLEDFSDISYAGSRCTMTIGELRDQFDFPREKEELLYKLAHHFRGDYGNYYLLETTFDSSWRESGSRPYDDFTVPVYHVWKKTVKNVGYLEGEDSYGKSIFDIDFSISKEEYKSSNKKRTGVVYPETSYEGWFAGSSDCPVCLEWGESFNQTREGKEKEKVLCPYIFFMPDNRGRMLEESAVAKVIPDIQTMDLAMLRIKMTIASHPPVGYAIDYEALMDVDLGDGTLNPIELDEIYQQTGKLYIKRRSESGMVDNSSPIMPLNLSIAEDINTYLTVYNNSLNNVRDALGINPNREGTANVNRMSNGAIQTQIAISQTATYYIYRSYLKATQTLIKHLGIRLIDALKYGDVNKGYLKYLGEENVEFIKSREDIIACNYEFNFDPQITKEEEERLQSLVMASVTARELTMPDALMIMGLKDVKLAEKYMRYYYKKNQERAWQQETERQQLQAQAQGDMAVRTEEAKRETFQVQSNLQAQEWKIKGESSTEVKIMDIVEKLIQAELDGKTLTPEQQQLMQIFYSNALNKQFKSTSETEQQMQAQQQEQEMAMQAEQIQQALDSGEINEQEAQEIWENR